MTDIINIKNIPTIILNKQFIIYKDQIIPMFVSYCGLIYDKEQSYSVGINFKLNINNGIIFYKKISYYNVSIFNFQKYEIFQKVAKYPWYNPETNPFILGSYGRL